MPKKIAPISFVQLEEALEERQSVSDRRQADAGLPKDVKEERRKRDRRNKPATETQH